MSPEAIDDRAPHGSTVALSLAALGVVYGDIGTSPLYAIRESFLPEHGVPADQAANVLGVLSLIFWSLVGVICIKYLVFVLRADNRGEGGILALTTLLVRPGEAHGSRRVLLLLGLFATALLYGDGMITPAISVLSAVEGLGVATEIFRPFILPIAVAILVGLFLFQSRGTARVGRLFGPVTLAWFVVLSLLGIAQLVREPGVLRALDPTHAVRFFAAHGLRAFLVLGSVFLVVTGGEALYADLGHFGRRPIRLAWFTLVLPALLLNYFGQGALILRTPEAVTNPFFHMVPGWALYPVVALATAATVIASQALISGAYSLTMQAVQLGYLPRLAIEHTSADRIGQIYIPAVTWTLMIACIALVLGFGTSSRMAAAYGVAVTTTMLVTSVLFIVLVRERWRWSLGATLLVGGAFLVIDLGFWGANLLKVTHGGWLPLAIGAVLFGLLLTWKWGRARLAERTFAMGVPPELFLGDLLEDSPARVPGTAVYMSSSPHLTPPALLHNLKHNRVLHERVVFLSVVTAEVPYVARGARAAVRPLYAGASQIVLHYGFMEEVNVPAALAQLRNGGPPFRELDTTYFLGRETVVPRRRPGAGRWRAGVFAAMARNAGDAAAYFRLPANRVVELGMQVEL